MSKTETSKTLYFFPNPHDSGESVAIEAESMEDALKQLEQQYTPVKDTPTHEPTPDAPEAVTESEN